MLRIAPAEYMGKSQVLDVDLRRFVGPSTSVVQEQKQQGTDGVPANLVGQKLCGVQSGRHKNAPARKQWRI